MLVPCSFFSFSLDLQTPQLLHKKVYYEAFCLNVSMLVFDYVYTNIGVLNIYSVNRPTILLRSHLSRNNHLILCKLQSPRLDLKGLIVEHNVASIHTFFSPKRNSYISTECLLRFTS